jgi:SAM-dependent methyltransferase
MKTATPLNVLDRDVIAGQAAYTRSTLAIYDQFALGFLCRFVWRCPRRKIVEAYQQHISANHLEVGVGTGYFLDHCEFPNPRPRLTLLDLNPNCLEYSARRLARFHPEVCQANVLEPLPLEGPKYDTIGMSALLHCLPGPMSAKGVAFDHLKEVLNPGGLLFGGTLLSGGVQRSWSARHAMRYFNSMGVFNNMDDDLEGLAAELNKRFVQVFIQVHGCAAFFSARA